MIFFWLFQIASLLFVLLSRYFLGITTDISTLLLSLLILISSPLLVPIVGIIREDATPMRSLLTRAGVIGFATLSLISFGLYSGAHISLALSIFIWLTGLAVYFRVESRVFFLVALAGLVATSSALFVGKASFAESASVIVFVSLVIGVFVEIMAPWFERLHQGSQPLVEVSPEFRTSYRYALSDYAWIITMVIQCFFVGAFLGRGTFWNFEYQMLLYLAFGVWIFFSLYLFSRERAHHIQDFITNRFSLQYIVSILKEKRKYIQYSIIGVFAMVLVQIIDWTKIWNLPGITLISFVMLVTLILGMLFYSIVSFFYRR